MGTKNGYTGGGGKSGKALRDNLTEWLDGLDLPSEDNTLADVPPQSLPTAVPQIQPQQLLPALNLFAPRGGAGDGPGGGGGGSPSGSGTGVQGGAQRSVTSSSRTAGRAAAAAYALRTGNEQVLEQLGLDYASLRDNTDITDVARQIVVAACGPLSDGTIEAEEQRVVAAEIAQYVMEAAGDGDNPPPLDEIVREAIAVILFEAISNETASMLHDGQQPVWATVEAERQMRDTAHALAFRAELSPTGPSSEEFSEAIARGMEAMRRIWSSE
ncbi:hypothetical protein ACIA48_02095 [Mycobacterium sp. NPDC051804]|uniref:hypothetical protein n=1 Tax=Mycobacterium sp. NPDC051804 TaxID=3364295 RepID=UPI0037AFAAE3